MAGSDDAFRAAGYPYPKNLTEVHGLPLIEWVIESLRGLLDAPNQLICAVRKDENHLFYTAQAVRLLVPSAHVYEVEGSTAGAVCTALLAVEHIDTDQPLVIVNGDQVIEADLTGIIGEFQRRSLDGGIVVFRAVHPRWSYVRLDDQGLVIEASEKRPISNMATAGFYYFERGSDFVAAAKGTIRKEAHVDGRYYVCPTYNEMILSQARVGVREIPRESYFSLKEPRDLERFDEHLRARPRPPISA